ncbi:putative cytosol aminopeptidase [Chlamydiales bacterium STE3]|nr:putative cytosol aminopeptidase [Chlamydiales bacterium STE3]
MHFTQVNHLAKRKAASLLVLPFFKGKEGAEQAFSESLPPFFKAPLEAKDFVGNEGETLMLYPPEQAEKRCVLLGLGEIKKISVEKLRRSFSQLVKVCHKHKLADLNITVPEIASFTDEQIARGVVEGLLLTNYVFDQLKGEKGKEEANSQLIEKVCLIYPSKNILNTAEKYLAIAEGVYFARDLVNGNADDVTPQYLCKAATGLAKNFSNVTTTIFDKRRIEKEQMGLLLAVNRGSHNDPAFIIIQYKGNPKSKDKTVLVGKGITYDTGGLNIKVSNMETMKGDMGGAAAAMGALYAVANLKLKINVTAVIPTTENSIGSRSYKPGDIYKSYSGKTVEIGNTDAEGRLILADALAYAVDHLAPTRMIDLATLTGAMIIALGTEAIGLFSNNDALSDSLIRSGSDTYERVWRMPLYEEYRDQLKSDFADIRNIGGRAAGSITAAMFLQEFVGKTPWAHLDIAGTAYLEDGAKRYHPKYGTGSAVRLLVDFLEQQ